MWSCCSRAASAMETRRSSGQNQLFFRANSQAFSLIGWFCFVCFRLFFWMVGVFLWQLLLMLLQSNTYLFNTMFLSLSWQFSLSSFFRTNLYMPTEMQSFPVSSYKLLPSQITVLFFSLLMAVNLILFFSTAGKNLYQFLLSFPSEALFMPVKTLRF